MTEESKDIDIAQKNWQREVEILKLLARDRQVKQIASQYGENEKRVTRIRNKACKYPVSIIKTLPTEIQEYIAMKAVKSRPLLWAMLFHREEIEAHWKELSIVAKQLEEKLLFLRENTFDMIATIHEIAVENDDYELLHLLDDPVGEQLLEHMQHELLELRGFSSWDDLRIRDISKNLLTALSSMSQQRRFEGICEVCTKLAQSSSNE